MADDDFELSIALVSRSLDANDTITKLCLKLSVDPKRSLWPSKSGHPKFSKFSGEVNATT
jgi:hypothetical protein